MPGNPELQRQLGSIDELLGRIESAADPSLRTTVRELVELVMNLNGAALERMLEVVRASGDGGEALIQKLGSDDLVGNLLVLYGLHPLKFETRVTQALEKVRSRLRLQNGEIELSSIQDGKVRLRLHAKSQGCGSTAQSLKETLEQAMYQAAPDLTTLIIDGAEEKQSFVPLEMLRASHAAPLAMNGSAGKGTL
jgi:Fe-S cluster biogenesis protein NfuA